MTQLIGMQAKAVEVCKPYGASVIVCTRNRGESIHKTISSILANTYPDFELIIVDQSTDDETERAVAPLSDDPRVSYIRSQSSGLSRARNIGLTAASCEIVLMTDDDCDVPADWIERMVEPFAQYHQVACVFCDVAAGPHDYTKGLIPFHIHAQEMLVTCIEEYRPGAGMGAGMGLRRSAIEKIGGFDQMLGAGVELASAEDLDVMLRLLLRGYHICHIKSVSVVHHGFRTYADSRQLIRGYIYGQSALYMKLLRCGQWQLLPLYLKSIHMNVTAVIVASLRQRQVPRVLGRIIYVIRGSIRGWRMPVDRATKLFVSERV